MCLTTQTPIIGCNDRSPASDNTNIQRTAATDSHAPLEVVGTSMCTTAFREVSPCARKYLGTFQNHTRAYLISSVWQINIAPLFRLRLLAQSSSLGLETGNLELQLRSTKLGFQSGSTAVLAMLSRGCHAPLD